QHLHISPHVRHRPEVGRLHLAKIECEPLQQAHPADIERLSLRTRNICPVGDGRIGSRTEKRPDDGVELCRLLLEAELRCNGFRLIAQPIELALAPAHYDLGKSSLELGARKRLRLSCAPLEAVRFSRK